MDRLQPLPADWLVGGGEMGARIRADDWSRTPLGPIEAWPQSLRSALSICLGSRFPIVLYWGADRTVLYNDAYAEILGTKHPWALGRACREVWAEIWDVIAPMLDGVVTSGEATWSDDQLLLLERRGYPEECYFSFSFSPVGGASRQAEGVFTAVIETTRRVLGERRLRTLRDLAARAALAKGEDDAWRGGAGCRIAFFLVTSRRLARGCCSSRGQSRRFVVCPVVPNRRGRVCGPPRRSPWLRASAVGNRPAVRALRRRARAAGRAARRSPLRVSCRGGRLAGSKLRARHFTHGRNG